MDFCLLLDLFGFGDFFCRSARIEPRLCVQMRLDARILIHQVSSKKDKIEGDS